jgi:hypothetical protein
LNEQFVGDHAAGDTVGVHYFAGAVRQDIDVCQ